MQPYGSYFPASYQSGYQQYQNQFQQNFSQPVQNQQALTPPTIHAEIIQIDGGRKEAEAFPVNIGSSQMFIAKDEQTIFIKTVYANGQQVVSEYQRREPEKEADPLENYVTKEMLDTRLQEVIAAISKKQEADEDESF